MPCYTVSTVTISWSVKSIEYLQQALMRSGYKNVKISTGQTQGNRVYASTYGWSFTFDLDKDTVTYKGSSNELPLLNEIKRNYSRVILEEESAKKNWFLNQQSKNVMTLRRY